MLSTSYGVHIGFIMVACAIIVILWSRDTSDLKRKTFMILNSKKHINESEIHNDFQNNANKTNNFVEILKQKYESIRFFGIRTINQDLNAEETEMLRMCVVNGPRDRNKNGSRFWSVQQIRRTHHKYLSRKDAVLLEVGGNQGDDAAEFVRLYNPRYLILEPLEQYAKLLTEKFQNNKRVKVLNLGLGAKNEIVMVKIQGNNACATSKFSTARGKIPLFVKNTTEFLQSIGVGIFDIDLITLNCEGCEFEVLESLLSTTLVNHLRNIQFATHSTIPGVKDPLRRYCRIQQLLSRTHVPTYQYKFIWENWRRRDLK